MKRLFYFAFGSNMFTKRLAFRVDHLGDVVAHSTYRLQGYKLVFNTGMKKHSYANIIEGESTDFVEGVLYELNQRQINCLNSYEGYPFNYEHRYFSLPDGNIGFAYVAFNELTKSKALPEIDYLNIMIMGALEHNLYSTYNRLVNYKNNNYTLKKGNKFKIVY